MTKNLLRSGKLTKKEIAQFTGLKLAQVNKLHKESEEFAKKLLSGKVTKKDIAKFTGLKLAQVNKLHKELKSG